MWYLYRRNVLRRQYGTYVLIQSTAKPSHESHAFQKSVHTDPKDPKAPRATDVLRLVLDTGEWHCTHFELILILVLRVARKARMVVTTHAAYS